MPNPPDPALAGPALSVPEVFAEQVRLHGGRPAIIDGGRVLTYRELHDQSRRVAGFLRGPAASESPVVAILVAHGADLVVALLAVLEAGKIAVVLDPADLAGRLAALLAEAEAGTLLADAAHAVLAAETAPPGVRVVLLDEARAAGAPRGPAASPDPGAVAIIVFTSGSTGTPKGVLATHSNLVLNVHNYARSADLGPEDRLTLLSRGHFMAGLSAIFGALLQGAALLPFDVRRRGFRQLHDWLLAERITLYHSVPTLFRRFCESLAPGVHFPMIRIVKLGGEPVMNHDVKLWQRHFPATSALINGLGLSEANGNLCHFKIDHGTPASFDVVPVGHALPGVEILLLDAAGGAVPAGGTGEIAFRCPHRSPGYWRSDDFAAQLVRPPCGGEGGPFFRTGDLGRFLTGGTLQHLGRKDDLLKLRGLRIEPAQVEAVLFEDPRIRHCAVGIRGEGSRPQQLVAWYVPAPGTAPTPGELRTLMARRLPSALVPSALVPLAEMPMTPGGKIDRNALPDPARAAPARTVGSGPPRDAVELALARIWRKVLRVPSAGRDDDFFALGGDSLSAAVLLSKIEAAFHADLDLGNFLVSPTLGELARLIRCASADMVHQRLVLTRHGGSATPFFFVPGAGAAGRPPRIDAAPALRPHYALQYRGLDGVEKPQRTVADMAAYFLGEVRRVQPSGPYLLGGGSFGALVALEAAHQLRGQGEEVRLLVVEDSLLDGCLTPRSGGPWTHRLERSLLGMLPVGKRFEFTWSGLREGLRQWRYRVLVPVARWRARLQEKPLPKVFRFHDLLNHSLAAKRHYLLRPYPGPVALLRTRFSGAHKLFALEPSLGWNRVCTHLTIHDLDGEKTERVADPVRRAAYLVRLDAVLEAAESGQG